MSDVIFILVFLTAFFVPLLLKAPAAEKFMRTWLGDDWRTTFYGYVSTWSGVLGLISVGLMAGYSNPEVVGEYWALIKIIPQDWLPKILGLATIFRLIAGQLDAKATKATKE